MYKKEISILLVISIFITFFVSTPVGAINIEHVINGGFETLTASGSPSGWNLKNGSVGDGFFFTEAGADGTGVSMKLMPQTTHVYVTQHVETLLAGFPYTFSAMLKVMELTGNNAVIKLSYLNADGNEINALTKRYSQNEADNVWTSISFSFTPPAGTKRVTVHVRNTAASGTLYWDDISIVGPIETITNVTDEYIEKPDSSVELLSNGSFETKNTSQKGAAGWSAIDKNNWGTETANYSIFLSNEEYHTGSTSVHMTCSAGSPYIKQTIDDPVVGATYQASFWYKICSLRASAGFKIEWYSEDAEGNKTMVSDVWAKNPPIESMTEGWEQFAYHFTIPKGCTTLTYYIRLYSTAGIVSDVYFDDASCYLIADAPAQPVEFSTDEIFYYSDMNDGVLTLQFNDAVFPTVQSADVELRSENGLIASATLTKGESESCTWTFPLTEMTEKAAHTVRVTPKNSEGIALGETLTETIHKYPRPSMMRTDGTLLVDGEPFYPVFVYHMNKAHLSYAASIGVNVSQASGCTTLAEAKEYLDEANKYGVKCLVPLYGGMKPAGHPDNVQNTMEMINGKTEIIDGLEVVTEGLKNHPALLGWMVMDEALSHWPDRWDLFYDSYKLIRDLDPVHPVYILQNRPLQFEKIAKYTDILAYDPYPNASRNLAQHVANYTEMAVEAVDYEKPVWSLNKASGPILEAGETGRGLPTIMEERNMWYQSLMAGASAVGFYSYSDCSGDKAMHSTPLYAGLTAFAASELSESYDYFLRREYPVFAEDRGEDAWYSAFVKNNKLYLFVINRFEAERQISIPLVSDGGDVEITNFTATRIYGGTETKTGNNTLNLILEPSAAYVYEITPDTTVNLSPLLSSNCRDLSGYPWVASAVRQMESLGFL
ncbi:MAG: hypothetical protein E7390_04365 [Ruminococcaceae bacterium]|nr:hypothetical protein [Oscillospiraceae bacterium]